MSLFEVKYTKKSSVSEHVSGIYKETSLYINGAMVYNKINTPLFIYKLPYNNLPLKEKYTGFNPIRLYEGRWVIGKIKDFGAYVTTVWAYSNKRLENDYLDCTDLEWYDSIDTTIINVTPLNI